MKVLPNYAPEGCFHAVGIYDITTDYLGRKIAVTTYKTMYLPLWKSYNPDTMRKQHNLIKEENGREYILRYGCEKFYLDTMIEYNVGRCEEMEVEITDLEED